MNEEHIQLLVHHELLPIFFAVLKNNMRENKSSCKHSNSTIVVSSKTPPRNKIRSMESEEIILVL